MRIFCKVQGQAAIVVGYCPGKKGKIHAIVVTDGVLKSVRLKDIELDEESLSTDDEKIVPLSKSA